eukprot:2866460-Pleurochrysis_carterae.AAC.1
MDEQVLDAGFNLRSVWAIASCLGEEMQPAAEESAHRPDTSRLLSRMESVDAGSQCRIIALRSGGGRVLHDRGR